MNSVTFKGVVSTSITGLLIQELGDLSKPAKRTERIEIDGMDGDRSNDLGYEAYKKSIKVGLHSGFDIDEIINYFDGAGDLILSNEPTKKYTARVDDNIDFERLIRFREGKVTFIVQPFKKLVDEDDVVSTVAEFTVENQGFVNSKPVFTIVADADEIIVVKVNDITVCTVTMPAEGTITLDSEAQNAYNTAGDKNQHVVGTFAELASGDNDIELEGVFDSVTVTPNSRWL